ncbi:MAG TPA: hypothetical protein PLL33_05245 [Paracoccus sp. (in: a-proteobacteria)]|nr:hypothetical protein [Paracoccus sp. (in: a-proteobacteria)]
MVLAPPELHPQTHATQYNRYCTGRYRAPTGGAAPLPLTNRKVMARRTALELSVGGVVNLGIGMPEGVAAAAAEEGLLSHVTLTAEPGVIGGQPASGLDFGAATNTGAIITQNQQSDFYNGGGLDLVCLGMADVDGAGNVNVSRADPQGLHRRRLWLQERQGQVGGAPLLEHRHPLQREHCPMSQGQFRAGRSGSCARYDQRDELRQER